MMEHLEQLLKMLQLMFLVQLLLTVLLFYLMFKEVLITMKQ